MFCRQPQCWRQDDIEVAACRMKCQQSYRATVYTEAVNSGKIKRKEAGEKKNQKAVSVSPILSFVVIFIIKTPDRIWFIPTVHKATVGLSAEGYQSIFSNHLILPTSNLYLPKISTAPRTSKHWFESTAVSGLGGQERHTTQTERSEGVQGQLGTSSVGGKSIWLPSDKKRVWRWKSRPIKALWEGSGTLDWQCVTLVPRVRVPEEKKIEFKSEWATALNSMTPGEVIPVIKGFLFSSFILSPYVLIQTHFLLSWFCHSVCLSVHGQSIKFTQSFGVNQWLWYPPPLKDQWLRLNGFHYPCFGHIRVHGVDMHADTPGHSFHTS